MKKVAAKVRSKSCVSQPKRHARYTDTPSAERIRLVKSLNQKIRRSVLVLLVSPADSDRSWSSRFS